MLNEHQCEVAKRIYLREQGSFCMGWNLTEHAFALECKRKKEAKQIQIRKKQNIFGLNIKLSRSVANGVSGEKVKDVV